jgi:16S rRNA (guanine966-N2)-methyltransferase
MAALGDALVDAVVWDLFAGSGALGLEALSRGARSAVLVEKARGPLSVIRANVRLLGAEPDATVVADDVFHFLKRTSPPADIALADPPYGTGSARRLVETYLAEPFAHQLWLEHAWREQLPLPTGARTRRYGDTALTMLSRS